MFYVVLGLLCILALFLVPRVMKIGRAGKEMKRIEAAGLEVRVATFVRLKTRYKSRYGDQGSVLARAITDELFSDLPADDSPAKAFSESNRTTIEKELAGLQNDKELLALVSITLSQEIGIRHAYGTSPEEIERTFSKLEHYGLRVLEESLTTDEFVCRAHEFFNDHASE